ncbi:hypothetical protein EHQ59_01620 [Leptospira kemamanensis]|uniref:DUF2846 domain-containing protein n=1 Tax=Leptospira kemamanensis TaxID=2484942 RepID=A0A4R9JUJ9_9LEPT|nr:hypothetical protein [Leptospira kemamanensis]TGL55975.1 hypothetical protein EHQ59_01620 [Leptospira kemamanensis]
MTSLRSFSNWVFFFCLSVCLGIQFQCTTKTKFQKLETKQLDTGLVYVIRPEHTSLALWDYDCIISKYPEKFSTSVTPKPIYKINLENGSLGYLRLSPGTYRLDVEGKSDVTKVFQIKAGEEKYFELKIFSETKMSKSEMMFREVNKEDSLSEILSVPFFIEVKSESI